MAPAYAAPGSGAGKPTPLWGSGKPTRPRGLGGMSSDTLRPLVWRSVGLGLGAAVRYPAAHKATR